MTDEEGQTSEVFLSTPSARRATPGVTDFSTFLIFLSTPSARRATSTWEVYFYD